MTEEKDKAQNKNRINPAQVLIYGFLALIIIGTILLKLPIATVKEGSLPIIDALFTATSAVCVTGLVVVDTGTNFTIFGQLVILILIQLGGLGFMTMATLIFLALGKRISLKERILIKEALSQMEISGVVRLVKYVLILTFTFQGLGAIILGTRFAFEYGLIKGFYYGLFHAISAFNNAGFDLIGNFRSMTPFNQDVTILVTIPLLFIIGGLGFSVAIDLFYNRRWFDYSFHTKNVLILTGSFLVLALVVILIMEWNNPETLGELSIPYKLLNAFFTGATPRTAGFNTIPTDGMVNVTTLFILIFMFIGASPASTGGGIKTTTFGTLFFTVIAVVQGKRDVTFFKRRIPFELITKCLAIIMISLFVVFLAAVFLLITEDAEFLDVLFEAISAFGTVGLSRGITSELTSAGKLIVTATMFVGRLGPLTLAFALTRDKEEPHIRYPEEKILVG